MLLLASFAHCNSSNSSEDSKRKLTAQKEELIDEISDLVTIIVEESEDSDKPKKETIAKAARLALSGLCGALEKEETGTIDAEFLDSLLPDEGHEVEKAIFLKFLSGDLELSKAAFENLLGRGDLEEQKINQLYELYNKTYCLVKVMKQIRELT